MKTNMTARLSQRSNDLHASPIREILAVANQPGMVSFAGGLPSPDSFLPCNLGRPSAFVLCRIINWR